MTTLVSLLSSQKSCKISSGNKEYTFKISSYTISSDPSCFLRWKYELVLIHFESLAYKYIIIINDSIQAASAYLLMLVKNRVEEVTLKFFVLFRIAFLMLNNADIYRVLKIERALVFGTIFFAPSSSFPSLCQYTICMYYVY